MHATSPALKTRRLDLDWLRVIAVFFVFLFHTARLYNLDDWHVKNSATYFDVSVITNIFQIWGMPVLMVISGAATFFALRTRSPLRFLKDRCLRLFIPLAVGLFTHIALQIYLDRLTHGQFRGSFWQFIPRYFEGLDGFGGNFPWHGQHLWYLELLFLLSVLLLPVLWWLQRGSGRRVFDAMTAFLARPAAMYLMALPVAVAMLAVDPDTLLGTRRLGGWNLVSYPLLFLNGFALAARPEIAQVIRRARWISLAAAVVTLLVAFFVWSGQGFAEPMFGTPIYALFQALLSLCSWCAVLAIWGFAVQGFTRPTPLLAYAGEAVLPFYILHQTVILVIGYYVTRGPLPDGLEWFVIVVSSFAVVMALYEFVVRRFNVMRVLFGMKPRLAEPQPRAPFEVAARV